MKVIGLTGGIGTGKSTVSRFMAELGAVIIDADKVGHEAFEPDGEIWQKIVDAFGKDVVKADGGISREKLGRIVFADPGARERLNRIMHPAMYRTVAAKIEEYRRQGVAVVVLEAPLLVEAGWGPLVDQVWVTVASETTVLKRLKDRSGLSEADSLARIRSQLSSEARAKHASVVINTDCTLEDVAARVKGLWQKLNAARA